MRGIVISDDSIQGRSSLLRDPATVIALWQGHSGGPLVLLW